MKTLMPNEALIRLENVTKTYRLGDEKLHALDSVNLTVKAGEFIAITGPSGSGKSTLANIIGGLDHVDSGSVIINGVDLSHAHDKDLSSYRNKYIGFVFQAFNLQPTYTALENVMIPLLLAGTPKKKRTTAAKEALAAVGLSDRIKHKPTQLSGGQRQRVSIARALANKPQLIIADEPTGNLDSARGKEIMALLDGLHKKGTTLIVISHDADVARQASRVVTIRDGKLTEGR